MRNTENEKVFAKQLFLEGVTRKEIAQRLKRTEKTIGKWVIDGKWENLKRSMLTTKDNQLTMLYNQLDWLNNDIANRESKIATAKEADIISKLTSAINKLETETSIGEVVEVSKQIIHFVQNIDLTFAQKLTSYIDAYIIEKLK